MSNLNPVIDKIISLLNNNYGTKISKDQFNVTAYIPKYDEDKKEFTKEDIKWLLQHLKSHSFSGGVRGLVKYMGDKFNNDLKQTIYDASKKFGDLEGVVKFLLDYDKLKDRLPRSKSITHTPPSQRLDVAEPIKKIKSYLEKVKEEYPKEYEGSFYQYTDKVLDKIQKYQRSNERSPKLERELLGIFVGEGEDNPGLIKGWRRLKVQGITEAVKDIYNKLAPYSEKEVTPKRDIINPPKESPLSPLEREVRRLTEESPKVEEEELEINSEMKGEKRKHVREVVKDIDAKEKYTHDLTTVKEYLKKAKSSYPQEFDEFSLHKYTADLVNALEGYASGKGRDEGTNKKISMIFNEDPGILKMWDLIHKPFAKNLRDLKGTFSTFVRTKQSNPSSIDRKILNKIDDLKDRTRLAVTDQDKTITKALLGKKVREYPDSGKSIDTTFFNKLIKEIVKHKKDFPKKPEAKDLDKLNLTEDQLAEAKTKEYMSLMSKAIGIIDKLLHDDSEISDEDLVTRVVKKLKEDINIKDKKEVVIDRNIKEEEEEKSKREDTLEEKVENKSQPKKQSSTDNVCESYKDTLFFKLERLANLSNDILVKAELENIVQDIKQFL